MSCCMGKPTICTGENKAAYQLCSNCTADQRLCFRHSDSTIPLLLISSFKLLALFCECTARFVSDLDGTQIVDFLTHRLKYISSSELKTSEFSRVRSTSENYYVFNSRDEIYLVFTEKKQIFFLFNTMHRHFPMHKVGGENAKAKIFENTNNFGTTLFLMF